MIANGGGPVSLEGTAAEQNWPHTPLKSWPLVSDEQPSRASPPLSPDSEQRKDKVVGQESPTGPRKRRGRVAEQDSPTSKPPGKVVWKDKGKASAQAGPSKATAGPSGSAGSDELGSSPV
jgi:hypothetical protein